jgi:hypothetical protein
LVKRVPTRNVDKSAAINYLRKAQQFSRAMLESLDKGDWDAAGLNAVHCAISASDAVLVFTQGIRSASSKHDDSAMLLDSMVKAPGTKSAVSQLKRLVAKKNLIEYEERMFRESEARDTAKNASRLLAWAETVLGR